MGFLLVAAGVLLTASLGVWQLDRARQKEAILERAAARLREPPVQVPDRVEEAESFLLRRVVAEGEFAAEHLIYLDNQIRNGRVGYHVLTPLRVGSAYVVVDRGWVVAGRTREELPAIATPLGHVRVEGRAIAPLRVLELEPAQSGARVWSAVRLDLYRERLRAPVQPFVIQQTGAPEDGLARDWPPPASGAERNRGYALQWFALSATLLILSTVAYVRGRKTT